MRLPRFRFTTRSLMMVVGGYALLLGLAPIGRDYWFRWTLLSDVKNGRMRYSPEGYASVGPSSTQALREALRSGPKKTRLAAAQALGNIGRDEKPTISKLAMPAIPDLIEAAMHDPDREVRISAIVGLGQLGPPAEDAVQPLIGLFEHEADPQITLVAIDALGLIGPGARPAVPLLTSMVKDPQHLARLFAAGPVPHRAGGAYGGVGRGAGTDHTARNGQDSPRSSLGSRGAQCDRSSGRGHHPGPGGCGTRSRSEGSRCRPCGVGSNQEGLQRQ